MPKSNNSADLNSSEIYTELQTALLDVAIAIGEYKGVLKTASADPQLFWGSACFAGTIRWRKVPAGDIDTTFWLSGAEHGTADMDPDIMAVVRWHQALGETWRYLQQRPVFNGTVAEFLLTSANGKKKKVRRQVADEWKQIESFLHLNTELDPVQRVFAAAAQIRKLKPFHRGSDELADVLPFLILAAEYEVPLPLSGYDVPQKNAALHDVLGHVAAELRATTETILHIRQLTHEAYERSLDLLPGRMRSLALFEVIFSKPVLKVKDLVEAGLVQRQTAAEYLRALEEVRMLSSRKMGREVLYRNDVLCSYLEERILEM